jgi:hypothetical protein
MSERQHNEQRVTITMATTLARRGDQALNFVRS